MKGMGKDKKIYWVVILVCIVFVCGSFAVYNKADAINDNHIQICTVWITVYMMNIRTL